MAEKEPRRLALYNGLHDVLGGELADTLMSYLPATTDLATRSDLRNEMGDLRGEMGDLKAEIDDLRTEVKEFKVEIREDIRHLSRRIDRMQQTTLAGFVALVAALLASGFLT